MIQSSTYKPRKRLKAMSLVKGLFGAAQPRSHALDSLTLSIICTVCIDVFSCINILIIYMRYNISIYIYVYICTSSTARGGGGSFKNRKPIGEIGCCESRMSDQNTDKLSN